MYVAPEPTLAAILEQFRRAGYSSLTPLQQRAIPLLLRGKDLATETEPGSGRIAAVVYSLIIGHQRLTPSPGRGLAAPRALLVAADADEVRQAAREWARFARAVGRAPAFVAVGEGDDVRREQRRLADDAVVAVGTVDRLIDHLRRGSLLLGELETVLISLPHGPGRDVFVRDVQFLLEKCPARRQTALFGRPPLRDREDLLALARRPQVIDAQQLAVAAPERTWISVEGTEKTEALARLLLGRPLLPALVLVAGRTDGEKISRRLAESHLRTAHVPAGAAPPARRRMASSFEAGDLDVLVASFPLADEIEPNRAAAVVWCDLPQPKDVRRAIPSRVPLIALVGPGQGREAVRLQESIGVSMRKEEPPDDEEMAAGAVARLLGRMRAAEPSTLARTAALVRRKVPLLKRARFAAYLLQSLLPLGHGAAPSRVDGATRQHPAPVAASQAGAERGRFTQLFVNAGRNRRVHARDLARLFQEKLGLPQGGIGAVRVFDKYSFVEVPAAMAAEAVSKLNGLPFGGRQLTVEMAKRHEGEPAR